MGIWWAVVFLGCVTAPLPSAENVGTSAQPLPGGAPAPAGPLVHPTPAGVLEVHPVRHGTLYLTVGERVVWLDPVGDLAAHPRGDTVLITDIHRDHLDPEALREVQAEGATVVGPKAVAEALGAQGAALRVLANGESVDLGGIEVTAVPMYNHSRGPAPGELYHEPGRGNGYVLTIGETRLYIAGDTACTDEMRALQGIDHAFLPMNLPYTMTPEEAAGCARAFEPRRVTPYHYRGSDLEVFRRALEGTTVEVHLVPFYPDR